jgi:hypothetical protein
VDDRLERVRGTPKAPTFVYNGINDELIWIKPLDQLVASWCKRGADIYYYRDPLGVEHIQGTANFAALGVPYLLARFAGEKAPTTCGGKPAGSDLPAPAKSTI